MIAFLFYPTILFLQAYSLRQPILFIGLLVESSTFLCNMLIHLFGNLPPLNNVYQFLAVLDEKLINAITTSLFLLLHYVLTVEKSNASVIFSPLWVICLFPVETFRILSLFWWFWNFKMMCKILRLSVSDFCKDVNSLIFSNFSVFHLLMVL